MSEQKKQAVRDYSAFDRMSTEMLEEILRKDFESPESDVDMILYITEVIAKRRKQNHPKEYPDVEQAWISFNQNYHNDDSALLDEPEDEEESGNASGMKVVPVRKKRRFMRRIAGVAAAVFVIICGCSITANAAGYNLWDIIIQWTSQTFGFSECKTGGTLENNQLETYTSLQAALDDYNITEDVAPTWVPEDYLLSSVEVTDYSSNVMIGANYNNGEKRIVVSIKHVMNRDYSSFEKNKMM